MNKRKWLIVVAVIVAIAAAYVAVSFYMKSMSKLWDAIFPARSVYTTSLKPIDITLTDPITNEKLYLRIPKAYLVKDENWRGGEQEIVVMQTRLPDMQPIAAYPEVRGTPGSEEYEKTLAVFNNGTEISLYHSYSKPGNPAEAHESVRERLSNARRTIGASRKYDLVDEGYFGLERYRIYGCGPPGEYAKEINAETGNETCVDTYLEEFLSKDRQQPLVDITCPVTDPKFFPKSYLRYQLGCHAHTSYRGHPLGFSIRHSQLNRWQEFDTAARRLLDGFVVESFSK